MLEPLIFVLGIATHSMLIFESHALEVCTLANCHAILRPSCQNATEMQSLNWVRLDRGNIYENETQKRAKS